MPGSNLGQHIDYPKTSGGFSQPVLKTAGIGIRIMPLFDPVWNDHKYIPITMSCLTVQICNMYAPS